MVPSLFPSEGNGLRPQLAELLEAQFSDGNELRPQLAELLAAQFPSLCSESLASMVFTWRRQANYLETLEQVENVERGLGPIGIWSVRYENGLFRYQYPKRFDSIYRPLKYVYLKFFTNSPLRLATTWEIVYFSTVHVESCLKEFCSRKNLQGYEKEPLVSLLQGCKRLIDAPLFEALDLLGKGTTNPSKHDYDVGTDQSLFSAEEAVATYLVCRRLGYDVLVSSGAMPDIIEACRNGPFLCPSLCIWDGQAIMGTSPTWTKPTLSLQRESSQRSTELPFQNSGFRDETPCGKPTLTRKTRANRRRSRARAKA